MTLLGLEQHADRVQVRMRSATGAEETLTAAYVIAADGAHSTVRKALGLTFEGQALSHSYVLGDVAVVGDIPDDQLSIFLADNGFLATFPLGDGRFRFMATDPDGVAGESGEPTLGAIQQLYDRVAARPAVVADLSWSSRFRINSRHMDTLMAGRVFFGGDAAHVHSPAGGQGMNAGVQDMINLSWKLAMVLDGRARPVLLDTYGSDRLPVIRRLVRMTERATRAFNSTNPVVHAALTRMAPLVLGRDAVQNKAVPRLGQIAASYRGAPITSGGGRIGDLRAGDRVPDLCVTALTGAQYRLYDLLDLSTLTLFLDGPTPDALLPWRGTIAVRRVCTGLPGWLLVRPDGYLAAAGKPADVRTLTGWLERWLVDPAG